MFPEEALSRSRLDVEITDPFFIFEIRNLFPESVFQDLDRQFPGKTLLTGVYSDRGNKSYLSSTSPAFHDFLESAATWSELYEKFCAPGVIEKLRAIALSEKSERPGFQKKTWRLVIDPGNPGMPPRKVRWRERFLGRVGNYTPIRVGFEFSRLENGCYLPPHTDVGSKLLSLMIYFPDDGVAYAEGAGTEFYLGKGGSPAWNRWKAGMLPDDEAAEFHEAHEVFYVSPFEANKLVGFVKSSNSWHGVRRLELPPGAGRRSLNINYYAV